MYSFETAREILEAAIDSLVDNFCREPFIHRCEHSLHCELYTMISAHRAFQGLYTIGNSSRKSSLVHKEWPELEIRQGRKKRGNFDLAILNPEDLLKNNLRNFMEGRFLPDFVVEIGLNYRTDAHLREDQEKLGYVTTQKAKIRTRTECYLVHLWQPYKGVSKKELQALQDFVKNPELKIAVAMLEDSRMWVKHLSDKDLRSS